MKKDSATAKNTMVMLVTGGAGFIGSNFIVHMLQEYIDIQIINLDILTYAGNLENLKSIEDDSRYTFVKGDICDRALLQSLFAQYKFTHVVHFAAESHVDRSITDPAVFLTTNIIGTEALLDAARNSWKINPQDKYCKLYKEGVLFHQVSTDEVYGALGKDGLFTEEMPLLPNSPYSASKASADLIARSYHKTYGFPVTISRCSNNYGPYQFPEKLIPLMINNCLLEKQLPVYGDGMQVRDWLHVKDHSIAIDYILTKGAAGEIYNIGGNNEKANIEIVKLIIDRLDKSDNLISYVKDRPGHDRRYAIDNTKITNKLGWSPSYTFEKGIEETIQWYLDNQEWIKNVVSGDYQRYYENMYN
ncbi:MAG: dTDP-glucose 4,6-dehydratase [Acholeplasmataceae bacterium]